MARKSKANPERLHADNPEWKAADFKRAKLGIRVPALRRVLSRSRPKG